MSDARTYSIVIPTYRRPDALGECLESVAALRHPVHRIEVLIIDNAGAENSQAAAVPFAGRLPIRYLVNGRNRGYGYSVNRGIAEASGDVVLLLNDDARPAVDLLEQCDRLLDRDPRIGCIGCRAIEAGYINTGEGIGRVDPSGEVVANFNIDCGDPIEVEHVYGFCYLFTREAIERAGLNDQTLLARPYSSGNRIETDHCLMIREAGLKVVYNPRMVATHLAKPRADMSEVSPRWKLNATRNTIYLYLKHYGPFGKRAAALRLTFLVDVGLLSTLRRPTAANAKYFALGMRGRLSAFGHYLLAKTRARELSVDAFRVRARLQDGEGERLGATATQ